jgi:hypothetical protein
VLGVSAIAIVPDDSNTIYIGTGEVYNYQDAGETWNQVHDVVMANDLVISPVDTNIVVVTCGNLGSEGHGIYRTIDGGLSWKKATSGVPPRFGGKGLLAISPSSPNVIYASIGNSYGEDNATWLCMSLDSGENWNIVSETDYSQWQGWFAHDVAVDPTTPINVITVGIDVWKSTSSGIRMDQKSYWYLYHTGPISPGEPERPDNYSHADHHDVMFHPTDPNIIYFANDGGVFRSTDGGETFEGCNGGYQTVQFYNGFSCSQQDSFLAMGGLQDNGTIIYRGTTTWDKFVVGGDGCWTAIGATNDNLLFASYQYLSVNKSTNGGRNWREVNIPDFGNQVVFVALYVLGVDNLNVIYAGQNGGYTWNEFPEGLPDAVIAMDLAISPTNRMLRVATHGNGAYQRKLLDGVPTGLTGTPTMPEAFKLEQNYPNPFNSRTRIAYSLAEPSQVLLRIFNALGQDIKTLVNNEEQTAGTHQIVWDGTDNYGQQVAAGTYIYQLKTEKTALSRRMSFIK